MDAGALGCEVIIAGKLTGPRARVQKLLKGTSSMLVNPVRPLFNMDMRLL
jgi:small subunit ribosomal protein S3